MSREVYRHRQVAWPVLAVPLAMLAVVAATLGRQDVGLPAAMVLIVGVGLFLLFGWLTVRVTEDAVSARFGIGAIWRTVPLRQIASVRAVRNRWYYGWGIRLIPGGWLYNVWGLSAVELQLHDGRLVRLGTDEPHALVSALEREVGPASSNAHVESAHPSSRFVLLVVVLVLMASAALVSALTVSAAQPPVVTVSPEGVEVRAGWYGTTVSTSTITSVTLERRLPRIGRRTNGSALLGHLRGHFDVDGLGNGYVFVDRSAAPYVLVRHVHGFVLVNLPDPSATRALYEQIRALE